ncbi:hypothetical protein CEUSTIGMA_g10415.t1 [Chlamydomonas eustigma]|uniref:Uncharacterized protein n=1 Tax=Chlamydomonas eustigma TaxID=1157962 RepID=A0A250XIT4_9CHLO|nr:hypothetical protein CEUSTIGMA_g10415.t1 [Chlamydomonas eustigma]|eukprot:GAX82988.1 hypothetical protein CEUSTIGMA_g10415.t1 [Chlamydomonas eustigma]
MHGPEQACRWRFCSWLERLKIAETESQFDRLRCEKQGFMLLNDPVTLRVSMIRLEGIGPKLLVSDLSTADVSLLRWRMEIRGNNAVEFGTIPVSLQDNPKSLHKCLADTCGERPSGFYSSITIGSLLPVRLPVMKGSIIEMVARRDRLDVIVTHPLDAAELSWKNTVTVPTAYKGPRELRFQQDLAPDCPVKLPIEYH